MRRVEMVVGWGGGGGGGGGGGAWPELIWLRIGTGGEHL